MISAAPATPAIAASGVIAAAPAFAATAPATVATPAIAARPAGPHPRRSPDRRPLDERSLAHDALVRQLDLVDEEPAVPHLGPPQQLGQLTPQLPEGSPGRQEHVLARMNGHTHVPQPHNTHAHSMSARAPGR